MRSAVRLGFWAVGLAILIAPAFYYGMYVFYKLTTSGFHFGHSLNVWGIDLPLRWAHCALSAMIVIGFALVVAAESTQRADGSKHRSASAFRQRSTPNSRMHRSGDYAASDHLVFRAAR
jgi:hypothetical protein